MGSTPPNEHGFQNTYKNYMGVPGGEGTVLRLQKRVLVGLGPYQLRFWCAFSRKASRLKHAHTRPSPGCRDKLQSQTLNPKVLKGF